MLDVMQACGTNIPSETYGVAQDPFEMFVRTLSQTPNSQRQYANLLLAKAAEKPEIQRFSDHLVPELSGHDHALPMPTSAAGTGFDGLGGVFDTTAVGLMPPVQQRPHWRGSIVGEIGEDGVYKVEDEGHDRQDENVVHWNDNAVWVTDTSNDGDSVMSGGVWM